MSDSILKVQLSVLVLIAAISLWCLLLRKAQVWLLIGIVICMKALIVAALLLVPRLTNSAHPVQYILFSLLALCIVMFIAGIGIITREKRSST